jgi:hypothetical protein
MPKDKRLYVHFDIGMDEHPKVMPLSDAAFRAMVEATLYSRRQLTDGFLATRIAERKWGADVIAELSSNDPERPTWRPHVKDGVDGYLIHDFDEHQTTTADIEAKRAAGKRGGLAKAANNASESVAPASTDVAPASEVVEQKASTTLAKTETETETTPTDVGVPRKRGARIPDDFTVTPDMVVWAKEHAPAVDGKRATDMFVNHWQSASGRNAAKIDWVKAWRNWMLSDQQRAEERGWKPQSQQRQPSSVAEMNARRDEVLARIEAEERAKDHERSA